MSRLSQSPLPTLPGGDCGLRAVDSVEHVLGHVGGVGRVDDAGRLVELHLGLEVVVLALHVDDHRVEEVDLGGGNSIGFKNRPKNAPKMQGPNSIEKKTTAKPLEKPTEIQF